MPDGMNDDLGLRGLVENQIGVRRHRHPTNGGIVRAAADVGVQQQKVGEGLDAGQDPPRALRRMGGDVIEDRAEVGKGPEMCSEASQTVFGAYRPHLFIGRKFATGGGSL